MKVTKSFTLRESTISRLDGFSEKEFLSNSAAVERILNNFFDVNDKETALNEEKKEATRKANEEFSEKNPINPDHQTPGGIDKVDVRAGEPGPSFESEE